MFMLNLCVLNKYADLIFVVCVCVCVCEYLLFVGDFNALEVI